MTPAEKQKVINATLAAVKRFGTALDVPVHPSFGIKQTVRELIENSLKDETTYQVIEQHLRTKQRRNPGATLESVIAELNSDETIKATFSFYTKELLVAPAHKIKSTPSPREPKKN